MKNVEKMNEREMRKEITRMREAILAIQELTAGEKTPRWKDQTAITNTRGVILDWCNFGLDDFS